MLLIIDLDDTIYATQSISADVVAPALSVIKKGLSIHGYESRNQKTKHGVHHIIQELWEHPFDVVARKYQFPQTLVDQFYAKINSMQFEFDILPYPDYTHLKAIEHTKVLVTTGFKQLQLAKIKSLGIASDFEAFHIDDPSDTKRKGKQQIFSEIIARSAIPKNRVWVIGDNPQSEILAGYNLGLTTVQVIKNNQTPSDLSTHIISSYQELPKLITGR
jgi:putative hydrolase of the HAD superfamily